MLSVRRRFQRERPPPGGLNVMPQRRDPAHSCDNDATLHRSPLVLSQHQGRRLPARHRRGHADQLADFRVFRITLDKAEPRSRITAVPYSATPGWCFDREPSLRRPSQSPRNPPPCCPRLPAPPGPELDQADRRETAFQPADSGSVVLNRPRPNGTAKSIASTDVPASRNALTKGQRDMLHRTGRALTNSSRW